MSGTVDEQVHGVSADAGLPARRSRGQAVLGVVGEVLITAGVIVLLFVVYQLFWTNVEAQRRSDALTQDLRRSWELPARPPAGPAATPAPGGSSPRLPGGALALMRIPRLGADWVQPVVAGVSLPDLAKGIGHYPQTARPGEVGNFAVAGHRATNGEPFRDIDRLRRGDRVIVETRRAVYTYVLDRHMIVNPQDVWVLEPVPGQPRATPTRRLITLTSCEPRWASYQRWIVFGHLESTRLRPGATTGQTPAVGQTPATGQTPTVGQTPAADPTRVVGPAR